MEERNVLSPEEVDAIIKAAQSASSDTSVAASEDQAANASNINTTALNNVLEMVRSNVETKLTVLFRKKITLKLTLSALTKMQDCLDRFKDTSVHSGITFQPVGSPCLISSSNTLVDLCLNVLYGGKPQKNDGQITSLGKIGVLTAEKIHEIFLTSFCEACAEYAGVESKINKSGSNLKNLNAIVEDEPIYAVDIKVCLDELETDLYLCLTEEFLIKIFPFQSGKGRHREKDFWRTAIKGEVVESYVSVSTTIADVRIKLTDFLQLKVGDEIPISDPTLVYVCLNNLKLYRGLAGQSNAKIVTKIVGQI